MGLMQEFKEFAVKGNVVDMAVGVIIGGAFGKIVASAVEDVVMPPLGLLLGGVDFSDLAVQLKAAVGDKPAVMLRWGKFVQMCIDFTIMAFAVFMMVRAMNRLKKPVAAPPPAGPTKDQELLMEIRDLLKKP
ncbi:MAG: large-conductance mechanosensitive channel protein MscL [Deltaproteobacteria bacterium]|jgi:large conductance mechanosensitive channel|nr:large-conductance mechanosensitive channel protein MscL [Deltaproteobacteria bacterium]MBK8239784.1 large-conductance mechanosensitive channel protein MscL [Deltaproteobacteria bacterium]MBK8714519.1 large-conductance mechanosensitive channel protein MscL [Deltaproteobacteria bacterium]MBP7288274.1 large-conductance mechanosensitive channel protein MscL [Nannocystaceae bacterium]